MKWGGREGGREGRRDGRELVKVGMCCAPACYGMNSLLSLFLPPHALTCSLLIFLALLLPMRKTEDMPPPPPPPPIPRIIMKNAPSTSSVGTSRIFRLERGRREGGRGERVMSVR